MEISIGCGEIASVQLLPELFRAFREKYGFLRFDMKEKWVVMMRADDALAEKESITAKDLSELPLILSRRTRVRSELASWFGDYYDKLDVVFTSNLNTNAAIMVESGLAYSIVVRN